MSVRAKMQCGSIDIGKVGAALNFSAVYEGSDELQGISENAIFGKATPCAWLNIVGPASAAEFVQNEEYYIDLVEPNGRSGPAVILGLRAIMVYRSGLDPNMPEAPTHFRFGLGPICRGMLDMSIANPAAVAWLDEHPELDLLVRLARGRRSDAEIEARERHLAVVEEECGRRWDKPDRYQSRRVHMIADDRDATREEFVAFFTAAERRKLAIARGEDPAT